MELNWDQSGYHDNTCLQATGVDKEGKKVKFSDGEEISYDKLLLATGSKSVYFFITPPLSPSLSSLSTIFLLYCMSL